MESYIGLDIGGTKISGVLINKKLKVLKENHRSIDKSSKSKILSTIFEMIDELLQDDTYSIGVGIPGVEKDDHIVEITNLKPSNILQIDILNPFAHSCAAFR